MSDKQPLKESSGPFPAGITYDDGITLSLAPPDMPLRPFRPEDLPALYKMIELYMPQVVSQPDYEEKRLAQKCREPFVWKG